MTSIGSTSLWTRSTVSRRPVRGVFTSSSNCRISWWSTRATSEHTDRTCPRCATGSGSPRPDSAIMMFLTVNTGSTSVKLSDYELSPTGEFTQCHVEHHEDGSSSPEAILGALQTRLGTPPKAVAHRIVHGGTRFNAPTRLDPAVIAELEGLSAMAPLHNPKALTWVRAVTSVWG